jgi:hypothetical protein
MAATKANLTHVIQRMDAVANAIMDLTNDSSFQIVQNTGTISKANILAVITTFQGERSKAKVAYDTASQ